MRRNRNVHGLLVLLGFVALLVPTAAMKAQGVPEDVTGSTLSAVTPATLTPGVTVNLCFTAHLVSPDFEYIDRFDVDLPDGWTIGTVAADSVPPANGCYLPPESGVDAGNVVYWQSPEDLPTWCGTWIGGSAGTDYDFCVEVTVPDCAGAPWDLPWNILGDTWGDPPNEVNGTFSSVACGASQAPNIDVDPLSLSSTQAPNTTETRTLTIGNDGEADLEWEIAEEPVLRALRRPVAERAGGVSGHGEWLYRAETGTPALSNRGGTKPARPAAYRWHAARPAQMNVLIYADDDYHEAPNTFLDQALQALGLSYTAHYDDDFAGFETDLAAGGWDLVLFGNDTYWPESSTLDALNAYAAGGGRVIVNSWVMADYPGHALWTTLGATWVADDDDPPAPVYWWQPGHRFFNVPNDVPEFTSLTDDVGYGTYGQYVEPLAGFQALAGYTTPGPDPNQAALILGNDGRTIFKGFLDGQNDADLDGDGVLDGVELWINMISSMSSPCTDPADVPWLSVSPDNGTTTAGASTPVTVTFDSTGLAVGTYHANLCVTSDDPDPGPGNGTDLVVVPVELVVEQALAPNIDVAPLSLSSSQAPNTASSQTLTVGNTGAVDLVWGIAEEPAAIPVQPLSRALDRTLAPGDGFAAPASAPVSFAPAIAAAVSTGESVRAVLDDFNRPDGPIGPNWTVHNGACNVVSNAATCTGSGRATFNSATGTGDQAEMDVAVFGTDLDYQALLLNYGAGANNLFIKVQLQDHHTQFDYAACYTGNNNSGASFGLGFFALSSPFTSAHMAVSRVGDDVTISFTNIDGGAQPPQTYVCSGAPPREGTGIGIAGYAGVDRVDNFGGSGGTAVCSNPADVPWLSVSPASGTTAAGASTPVTVTFDSTGLAAGAYGANLCITSNDPDAGPGNGTDLVVVPVSLTVTAPVTHTVTASVGTPAGTIVPPSQIVADGATATFTLTPDTGYEIDGVGGTCPAGTLAGNVYTTGPITADCEVVANFRQLTHTVTSSVGTPAGTIVPPSQTVAHGATATFTLTPDSGFEIDGMDGTCPAGSLVGNLYTTEAITADCTVIANFRPEAGPGPSVLEIPTLGPAGGALLGLLLAGLGLGTIRRRRA